MPPAKTLLALLAAACAFSPPAMAQAASPADQYVMFVSDLQVFPSSNNQIPPSPPFIGSIEVADYYVNSFADDAEISKWDGVTYVFKAVMSISTNPAISHIFVGMEPGKPILNTAGQPIVARQFEPPLHEPNRRGIAAQAPSQAEQIPATTASLSTSHLLSTPKFAGKKLPKKSSKKVVEIGRAPC
jgi:hypothetical protein